MTEHNDNSIPPVRCAAAADIGKVRDANEDAYSAHDELGLYIVADGMGGHRGGDIASRLTVDHLPELIAEATARRRRTPRAIKNMLDRALTDLNRHVREQGRTEDGYPDMGSTIVLALVRPGRIFVANVGDSRCYRVRNRRLTQLSCDHSIVSTLLDRGHIEPENVTMHPAAGVITQYIGMAERVRPCIRSFATRVGDRFLLCSDGLTDLVDDATIVRLLNENDNAQNACEALVAAANDASGHDNITVMLLEVTHEG